MEHLKNELVQKRGTTRIRFLGFKGTTTVLGMQIFEFLIKMNSGDHKRTNFSSKKGTSRVRFLSR